MLQRRKIVNGIYEPSKAETQWNLDEENENLSREVKAKAKIAESEKNEEIFPEDVKGIPKFWLTVLKNAYIFKNIIQVCFFVGVNFVSSVCLFQSVYVFLSDFMKIYASIY